MIKNYLLWREKQKKIWRETAVFGGNGGFGTVSSQFHIPQKKLLCRILELKLFYGLISCAFYFWFQKVSHPPPPFVKKKDDNINM